MRILISNDDGVHAAGLAALREAVEGLGEVTVVAPDSPQSAAGHAITLKRPLTVREARIGPNRDLPALSVDGRPADCVRLAVSQLMPDRPDIVLSGINAGANVGVNVFYSGTVAAAAEGAMLAIPAVAFSAEVNDRTDYDHVADLCRWVLDRLLDWGLQRGDLLNVNIPASDGGPPAGLRVVRQSTAEIEDVYHPLDANGDGRRFALGDEYRFIGHENDDVACLAEGIVTVTPLHVDMTNHVRLERLMRHRWDPLPQRTCGDPRRGR